MSLPRWTALVAAGSLLLLVGGRTTDAMTRPDGPRPLPAPVDQTRVTRPEVTSSPDASVRSSLGVTLRPAVPGTSRDEHLTDAGAPDANRLTDRERRLLAEARAARARHTPGETPVPAAEKTSPLPALVPDPVSGVGVTTFVQETGPAGPTPTETRKRDHHRGAPRRAGEGR